MVKPIIIFRALSTILCAIGLLYQSCQLLYQYLSGKSVVNIEVRHEINANLPAITICYPEMISMQMAANYSDTYRGNFEIYKNLIKVVKNNATKYEELKNNMTNLHQAFKDRFYSIENIDNYLDKFFKMSLPFKYYNHLYGMNENMKIETSIHEYDKSIITIELEGHIIEDGKNFSFFKKKMSNKTRYIYQENPVETISLKHHVKCFTFFSFINPIWSDIKLNKFDLKIHIAINYDVNWFPPNLVENFKLAIHSPKIIPEFKNIEFFEIISNIFKYYITFTKIKVDEYEVKSDCKMNYEDSLRSDCIARCVLRKSLDNNIPHAALSISILLRKEHANETKKPPDKHKHQYTSDELSKTRKDCHTICKQYCQYSYYVYEFERVQDENKLLYGKTEKHGTITLQHNRLPDLFIQHKPETTFVSFVGNFGGLLGMWLGLSVFSISNDMFAISKTIINAFVVKFYPILIPYRLSINININNFCRNFDCLNRQ